jgi:ABC-2 type transport system permease protein
MAMQMAKEWARPELPPEFGRLLPRVRKNGSDFWWLLCGQLFNLRLTWFWYGFQMAFVPLSFVAFFWLFIGRERPEAMVAVVTGSLVMNVTMGSMLSLGQAIGSMKDANAYEYYAALPISRAVFLAALTTRGVLLTLPAALGVFAVGAVLFRLALTPIAVLVLVLSAFALSGMGALIGFWSPTGQVASLATQIIQPLITFLAPVYFPVEQLPPILQVTSRFLPTTYAAVALRKTTAGGSLGDVWIEILVLLGFAVLSLILVPLKLSWRAR